MPLLFQRLFLWWAAKAASAVRSPWFFIIFNAWTIAWFVGLGGFLHDGYPYVFWVTVVTYMTQADLILFGMWQKGLQLQQDRTMRKIEENQRMLLVVAKGVQALVEAVRTDLAEQEQILEDIRYAREENNLAHDDAVSTAQVGVGEDTED